MEKPFPTYNIKQAKTQIKDIDLSAREVAIYLSVFDTIDSDNDLIRKGAFKKSLNDRGVNSGSNRQIAFLRHHDWEHQIGKFTSLQEDETGLFAVGKLGTSTKGDDALRDYQDGIITEHSIGFQYIADKTNYIEVGTKDADDPDESTGYFEIKELKLWEGSAVTFGANQYANTIDVFKTIQEKQTIQKSLTDQMNIIVKAITSGKGTDERLYDLEMKLKYLNARLIDVANTDPFNKEQLAVKQTPIIQTFNWSGFDDYFHTKQTFNDYPQQAVDNAKKGIELNSAVGNKCATNVGKQRATDIVAKRGFSLDVLKRVYAYLSRAKTYYDANDTKACGTISYLLWGGEAMRVWSENKLNDLK
jgi:hypothetical protein